MSAFVERLSRAWTRVAGPAPVTLIGHSHIWAMAEAAAESQRNIRVLDFWKFADPFAQNEMSVIDTMLPPPARGPLVSLIGGSRYNNLTLYESSRPFDFVSPQDPDAQLEGVEILPFDAVREALLSIMQSNLNLMKAVRERVNGRVYHLDAPPPWGEDRNPADYPKDPWLQVSDRFGDRRLRLKTSRLETRLVREFCAANDIGFIDAPPASRDAEGFLKTEYFKDLMHANAAYGRVALAHVLAVIKK